MKKICMLFLSLLLLTFCLLPAAAYAPGESAGVEVFAVYRYLPGAGEFTAAERNGVFTVELPDGVRFTVENKEGVLTGLTLVVLPVTQPEALDWLGECCAPFGDGMLPYAVYFTDAAGKRVDVRGTRVGLTVPSAYTAPALCAVSAGGEAALLASATAGNTLSFVMNGSDYYAVLRRTAVDGQEAPQTGDDFTGSFYLYLSLALLSVAAITAAALGSRKILSGK